MHTICTKKLSVSCHFNGTARSIPFPFLILSFFVCIFFEVHVHFLSISKLLYIRTVFSISLHIAVYGFYRVCMQDSSLCEVRRKMVSHMSHITPLQIFLVPMSHASLNHTLCLRDFCSCSSDPVSTRLWLWLLKVHVAGKA